MDKNLVIVICFGIIATSVISQSLIIFYLLKKLSRYKEFYRY